MAHFVNPDFIPFSIVSGSPTSQMIELDGRQLVGIIVSASGSQLYFDTQRNGETTVYPLYSGGAWYSATVAAEANVWNVLDAEQFLGVNRIRFNFTGVPQATGVTGSAIVRPI